MLELTIVVVYFLIVIVIGLISRKRMGGLDGFIVAGRSGSSLFITGSLVATIIGGSATMLMAEMAYQRGLTGVWWLLAGSVGLIVLGIFFAKKVREYGLYTLPELAGKQYDNRVSLAASILIAIAWLGIVAGQIIASGTIMSVLGVGSPQLWMVLFSVVFIFYTLIGGQRAVVRTDIIQTVVIFIGIFTALALSLYHIGGIGELKAKLNPEYFAFPISSSFDGGDLAKLLLLVGLTYVVGPDMYSRLFCAKDTGTARRSVFWAAFLIIPIALGVAFIGMGAAAIFPDIPPNQAFPMIIKEVLPPVAGAVVLAGLLCAVMSSADTTLLSASTILAVDIIGRIKPSSSQERTLTITKWGIVILGLLSMMIALLLKDIISAMMFAYTIYSGGVILPVIVGFYRKKLNVTPIAALIAIICGGAVALASKIFAIKYLDLGSLLVSALVLIIVSIIDNRLRRSSLDL